MAVEDRHLAWPGIPQPSSSGAQLDTDMATAALALAVRETERTGPQAQCLCHLILQTPLQDKLQLYPPVGGTSHSSPSELC